MLSLHQQADRLRNSNNLIPTGKGLMRSRPGAIQLVDGDIAHAQPWGNRALLEKQGRLILWDGNENDIAPSGYHLQASAFQAYTQNAQREDRLYVADGIKPLWYITQLADKSYQKTMVLNSVKDENGVAYPLPVPRSITTWRNRLFISDGSNRASHCQNNAPEEWDPLWSLEFQTESPDVIQLLESSGNALLVGLTKSCFAVSGTSQLNWSRDPIPNANGVTGSNAATSKAEGTYWVSRSGIESNQQNFPIDDIKKAFHSNVSDSHIEIDSRRNLLFLLIGNRLFVMHLSRPGFFGEITGYNIRGLIAFDDYVGWYGEDGLWVLGSEDEPDRFLDGTTNDFTSLYKTWDDTPNEDGQSSLPRVFIKVKGSARGNGSYTLGRDGEDIFTSVFTLSDQDIDTGAEVVAGADGEYISPAPVVREFTPHEAGTSFNHSLSAPCHMEVVSFKAEYKFRG